MPAVHPSRRSPSFSRRRSRRLIAALAVLAAPLITAAAASPATAVSRCAPADGLRSSAIAQKQHADGTAEITEYMPRGEYRVTRCGKDGRPRLSETISPIRDPDGGVALVPTEREAPGVSVSLLYGDPAEASWAADFRATRAARQAQLTAPTAPLATAPVALPPAPADAPAAPDKAGSEAPAAPVAPAAPAPGLAAAAAVNDTCTNAQYAFWMGSWVSRTYGYRINRSRFSYNDTTVASLVRSHTNWDTTYNSCGLNDITNLKSTHLGSTSLTMHSYRDGTSVTDRGDMASVGCAGALACTFNFTDASGTVESDQRYNDRIEFSNVGAAGAYDFQAVGTHESGHTIGLNHANSSSRLTMYYAISAGDTQARSLAKGDVMGMRARYP